MQQNRDEKNRAHKERDRELNMHIDKLEEDIDQLARVIFSRESERDGLDKAIREKAFEDDSNAFSSRMASDDGMESTKKRMEPPKLSQGSRRLSEPSGTANSKGVTEPMGEQ